MKTRFKYCLFTAFLTIAVSSFCRLALPPMFQFILVQGAHFLFLGLAALWLVFRFSGFTLREHFFYISIGTVNTSLGIMALGLYFFSNANVNLPATMAVNLVIGVFMLTDSLFLPRMKYERSAAGDDQ